MQIIETLSTTAETLNQMVKFLSEQHGTSDKALQEILLSNHPIFQKLRNLTNTPYRFLFYNRAELDTWLKVRGYDTVPPASWDDPQHMEWTKDAGSDEFLLLKIKAGVFDESGRLRVFTSENWDPKWVTQEKRAQESPEPEPAPVSDEDIPF